MSNKPVETAAIYARVSTNDQTCDLQLSLGISRTESLTADLKGIEIECRKSAEQFRLRG
jgi:predicted site-specific integrase-resolvase